MNKYIHLSIFNTMAFKRQLAYCLPKFLRVQSDHTRTIEQGKL